MTPEQFAYWLQGFAEINEAPPTEAQWKCIKEHLATVFKKVTPNYAPNPFKRGKDEAFLIDEYQPLDITGHLYPCPGKVEVTC